jgi:molybdopterin-containing oxidoreductase family iron-sulfur binding subunit
MSKRVFHHPPEAATGRKYWRSLGQLGDTPEFRQWLEREFPQGASEFAGGEVSRRSFLQLMGASTALAGLSLAGCRRPEKHLVPFTRGVEWSIPGKALFYATSRPWRNGYAPVVAQTNDGRPTKVDGNPLHPASKGASDAFTQASLLDLYDPDRSRHFTFKGEAKSGADFEKALDELIGKSSDGSGLAFLLERNPSPSRERLRGEIEKKFPKAIWSVYEPLGGDAPAEAARAAFGDGVAVLPQLTKADVIMALDADFLGCESTLIGAREFAARRSADGDNKMNRLYVVENRFTLTGGMSDHRMRVPASQIGAFAIALAEEIAAQTKDDSLGKLVAGAPKAQTKFKADWIKVAAEDLVANKGKSLVLVGSRQPAAVQVLGLAINAALGSIGQTLTGRKIGEKAAAGIVELAQALGDKKISTLVIVGGNPVYNAPADLDFAAKLKNVETVVRVSSNPDETTEFATWQVPGTHYLESWGDGRAIDGSYVSVQPMIMPLYDGWSELDVLAKFAGQAKPKGPELVQETFRQVVKPGNFTEEWAKFLHDGFQGGTAAPAEALTLNADALSKPLGEIFVTALDGESYEIVLAGDSKIDDGRLANNGWLQELPDPITKMTWDNAAWISPATAKKLNVEQGHLIEISVENRKIEQIVVAIVPGMRTIRSPSRSAMAARTRAA